MLSAQVVCARERSERIRQHWHDVHPFVIGRSHASGEDPTERHHRARF